MLTRSHTLALYRMNANITHTLISPDSLKYKFYLVFWGEKHHYTHLPLGLATKRSRRKETLDLTKSENKISICLPQMTNVNSQSCVICAVEAG